MPSVIDLAAKRPAKDANKLTPMFGPQERTVTFVGEQIEENGEPMYCICVSVTIANGNTDSVFNVFKENKGIGLTWPPKEILLFDVHGHLIKV